MAIYDDFEAGNLDKWDYWELAASDYAQVDEGDGNMSTRHLSMYSVYLSRQSLLSNGDVGSGKYLKCKARWDNISGGGISFVIRGTADIVYLGHGDGTNTRIFKVTNFQAGPSYTLLKTGGSGWVQHTDFEVEFYQEADGNLVVKRDGLIQAEVINTELSGTKIGFVGTNERYLWIDNVEDDREEEPPPTGISRRSMSRTIGRTTGRF